MAVFFACLFVCFFCSCCWFSFVLFIYSFISLFVYFFIWHGVGTKDWVFHEGRRAAGGGGERGRGCKHQIERILGIWGKLGIIISAGQNNWEVFLIW